MISSDYWGGGRHACDIQYYRETMNPAEFDIFNLKVEGLSCGETAGIRSLSLTHIRRELIS
jgi:DNA-binding CsgD family transcriptional regulator